MFTIRKKFRVEMAHQLYSSFSAACHETIHGHSYVIEIILGSKVLNKDGMVVDFGCLHSLKDMLMEEYDHALLMPADFPTAYLTMLGTFNKKLRVVDMNPTAEWMAETIYHDVNRWLVTMRDISSVDVRVKSVRVHETETGWAEYSEEGDGNG